MRSTTENILPMVREAADLSVGRRSDRTGTHPGRRPSQTFTRPGRDPSRAHPRPGRRGGRPLRIGLVVLLAFAAPVVAQHEGHGEHSGQSDHSGHMARAAAAADEPEQLSGLTVPDVEVVTQDGETVQFYSDLVEDRVVAMNFVFTTCTTVCPPMGAIFGRLEEQLGERAGRDVHLISVSVDPTTDTPERLRQWAAKFGRTPGWTLVTGDKTTVNSLLKSLQVFTPDFEDHAPTVLLGNDLRDEWTRAYGLASPDRLAELLDELAAADTAAEGR